MDDFTELLEVLRQDIIGTTKPLLFTPEACMPDIRVVPMYALVIMVVATLASSLVGKNCCSIRDAVPLGGVCLYEGDCRSYARLAKGDGTFLDVIHCTCLRHRCLRIAAGPSVNVFNAGFSALGYVHHLGSMFTLQAFVARLPVSGDPFNAADMWNSPMIFRFLRGIAVVSILGATLSRLISAEFVFFASFFLWCASIPDSADFEISHLDWWQIAMCCVALVAYAFFPNMVFAGTGGRHPLPRKDWIGVVLCIPVAAVAFSSTPWIAVGLQNAVIFTLMEQGITNLLCIESLYHGTSPINAAAMIRNGGAHTDRKKHLLAIAGGSTKEVGLDDDTTGKLYFFKDTGFPISDLWLHNLFLRKLFARYHASLATQSMLKRVFLYEHVWRRIPGAQVLWWFTVDPMAACIAHFVPLVKLRVPAACVSKSSGGKIIFQNDPCYGGLAWFTEAPVTPWNFGLSGTMLAMLHPTQFIHMFRNAFTPKWNLGLLELILAFILFSCPGLVVNSPVLAMTTAVFLPFLL